MFLMVHNGGAYSVLPSQTDPIRLWRRRFVVSTTVALVALGLCAAWAWLPVTSIEINSVTTNASIPSDSRDAHQTHSLDQSVFGVELWSWVDPQAPGDPPAPIAPLVIPTPPIQIELVSIIRRDGKLMAALYLPNTDTLRIVAAGDQINRHTITVISDHAVELSDGRITSRLELVEQEP